jgi:hypothetical protein
MIIKKEWIGKERRSWFVLLGTLGKSAQSTSSSSQPLVEIDSREQQAEGKGEGMSWVGLSFHPSSHRLHLLALGSLPKGGGRSIEKCGRDD